jgi:D-tyrosyl-tRNA(Tyr) deacylase
LGSEELRALVQRVGRGSVFVRDTGEKQSIGKGMVILLGVRASDDIEDCNFVADKCANLRIFEDDNNKMNISIKETGGEMLIVSQFTLYGDARKGNRPNFTDAADPDKAEFLYEKFIERLRGNLDEDKIKSGQFGAMMDIEILNDGPVTLLVESKEKRE